MSDALVALLAAPCGALAAAGALSGRAARAMPGRLALVAAAALLLGAGVFAAARTIRAVGRATDANGTRQRRFWVAAGGLIVMVICAALLVGDRTMLVRRYAVIHATAELVAFFGVEAALWLTVRGLRPTRAPLPSPALLATFVVTLVAGAGSLVHLRFAAGDATRAGLFEHTQVAAALMDGASALLPGDAPLGSDDELLPSGGAPAKHAAALAGRDVVLVTVDALRADHLGAYGYPRPTSPVLDALAARGVLFERAYASSPHTSFSLVSLLTGRHANALARAGVLDGAPTLADVFQAAGYRAAGVFPPAVFFVEGEKFRAHEARRLGFELVDYASYDDRVDAVTRTDRALALLEQAGSRPVFLWVHHFGPHEPYVHHPGETPFGKSDRDRYDEEIRVVDREIGRLVAGVRAVRPRAVVVVTADHGEEFAERGGAYHGTTLHDEQIRVPLIVEGAGVTARRVRAPVSTVDVAPTMAALVGLRWPAVPEGAVFSDVLLDPTADEPSAPVFAELEGMKAMVVGSEKLICDMSRAYCRLYDLATDPAERIDLASSRSIATLRARLLRWARMPVSTVQDVTEHGAGALVAAAERRDGEAVAALARALVAPAADLLSAADRLRAVRLLARSPEATHRPALTLVLETTRDERLRSWAAIGLAKLGDRSALDLVAGDGPEADPEVQAHRALALASAAHPAATPALAVALERMDDVNLRCQLLAALGARREALAMDAVVAAYPHVRGRVCAAQALVALRSPSLLPFVAGQLAVEPYSTVRVHLARALGATGDRRAVPALEAALRGDTEETVIAAAAGALAELAPTPPTSKRRRPLVARRQP